MKLKLLSFAAIFLSFSPSSSAELSCLDRQKKPTPWFNLIKFPGNLTKSQSHYAYLDPKIGSAFSVVDGALVDGSSEALPNTIASINLLASKDLNVLVFNDQPPDRQYNPDGAHAKGIIAYDNKTKSGVYIMHSFPKFPSVIGDKISPILPNNTRTYGQNAYCISINEENLKVIYEHLPVEQPNVYHATGIFKKLAKNSTVNYKVSQFKLKNGDIHYMVTKNPNYPNFLYEDIIAPQLKVSLATQTWGRPYLPPSCAKSRETVNINEIKFKSGASWDHSQDHSKWAVSVGKTGLNVGCSCDMNRQATQSRRGGSCLCSTNEQLFGALTSLISKKEKCPTGKFLELEA